MADVFAAFRETDLIGMAGYRTQAGAKQAHKGLLWGMYVRSIARGTGVAKHLVEAVLGHARERVELVQLTVVSENKAAQRLYRSCGFVAYGHEVHALKQGGRYSMKFSWPSRSTRGINTADSHLPIPYSGNREETCRSGYR
jgi:ribosomal protein S18 acetylase RimI-like enzyme